MKNWLLLLAAVVIFYGSSVFYGFSQDDFFHLAISRAESLSSFLQFFLPQPDAWVFYRPLSTQLWYWLFTVVLGWQQAPLPMHLASLLIHSLNAYLIFLLLTRNFGLTRRTSLLAATLYAVSSVHFLSLFYLGATQQLLTTFFALLTLRAHFAGLRLREIVFFVLSLLSKEIAVRLVPIVILLRVIKGDSWRIAISRSLPLLGVTLIYLGLRAAFGVVTPPEYHFDFGPLTSGATLMWYSLMSLGAPEHLLTYGLSAGRIDLTRFVAEFPLLGILNLTAISLLILGLIFSHKPRNVLLYAALFLAGVAPVFFLPTHRYAHYLDLSFVPLLALYFSPRQSRWFKLVAAALLLVAFTSGQLIDRRTHWTIKRAGMASEYTGIIRNSGACQSGSVAFVGTGRAPTELSYALMLEHGPQIICDDPDLGVYYGEYGNSPSGATLIDLE